LDNNFGQEKDEAFILSMNNYNHYNKGSCLIEKDQLPKLNSLKPIEPSNLKDDDYDNMKIFNNLSQISENELNTDLPGLYK